METNPHLYSEEEVVWLREPSVFPYLRESVMRSSRKDKLLKNSFTKDGELIGYVILTPETRGVHGRYYRRMWWFKTDGRDPFCGSYPGEAVKPSSIRTGFSSEPGRDW